MADDSGDFSLYSLHRYKEYLTKERVLHGFKEHMRQTETEQMTQSHSDTESDKWWIYKEQMTQSHSGTESDRSWIYKEQMTRG